MARPERLLWIGGTSGAGKSTAARLLARRRGLRCYSTDTSTWSHHDRAESYRARSQRRTDSGTSREHAALREVDRSCYVLDDVRALPSHPPTIVEGTAVIPTKLPAGAAALWLVAHPQTRAARAARRGWGDAGGPTDITRSVELHDQIRAAGVTVINTTDHAEPADTVAAVEADHGVRTWLSHHPGVTDPVLRRRLRRDVNRAVVDQYHAGWRHHGVNPDPTVIRALECECSDPLCCAFVELSIADLPAPLPWDAPAVLADGHTGASESGD